MRARKRSRPTHPTASQARVGSGATRCHPVASANRSCVNPPPYLPERTILFVHVPRSEQAFVAIRVIASVRGTLPPPMNEPRVSRDRAQWLTTASIGLTGGYFLEEILGIEEPGPRPAWSISRPLKRRRPQRLPERNQ